jgi:hypothetical protein
MLSTTLKFQPILPISISSESRISPILSSRHYFAIISTKLRTMETCANTRTVVQHYTLNAGTHT